MDLKAIANGLPELGRILVISVLALAGDLAVLFISSSGLKINYLLSASLAFLTGLTINYLLSIRWGFSTRRLADPRREFLIFCLVGLTGAGLNELIIWSLTGHLGVQLIFSKGASVATVFWWNYGMRKLLLFS